MRQTPNRKAIASLITAIALTAVIGVSASYGGQASVGGVLRTGGVSVCASWNGPTDAPALSTGGSVPVSALVGNAGDSAWVRAKVLYEVEDAPFGAASWEGGERTADTSWLLAPDGWWYLTCPLGAGEEASFSAELPLPAFEQVRSGSGWEWVPALSGTDPDKWSEPSPDPDDDQALRALEDAEGARLRCRVTFEAVQERNFDPDFYGDHPWGGVEADAKGTAEGSGAR